MATIPQDPAQIKALADRYMNSALSTKDQLEQSWKQKEFNAPKPTEVNLGGKVVILDMNPNSSTYKQEVSSFNKTQTPDSIASNQVAMRGQDMTDARGREANDIARNTAELNQTKIKQDITTNQNSKAGAVQGYDTAISTLGRLRTHPGLSASVGLRNPLKGSLGIANVPGSPAANFSAELEAFKSQTFLPMVQNLRGMGALSDAEGKKLSAAVGALDPNMSETEFKASIDRIEADLTAARNRISGGQNIIPSGAAGGTIDFGALK
jgi:hypothetical protein